MASTHKSLRTGTANKRPTTSISDGQIALNTNIASPGLFFKDSAGNVLIKIGPVHVGTTAPNVSPAAGGSTGNSTGEAWLDTSLTPNGWKVWTGSAWLNATPAGSETVQGLLELATNAETQAGTDTARAITPAGLQSKMSDSVSTTSATTIASSTAVKSAYDLANSALPKTGGRVTGNIEIGPTGSLTFEGAADDAFETFITVAEPTADRTITLPNTTGTVITSGDTGTVTSAMIADNSIVDGDISSTAAISLSKLATGALPTAITITSANITDSTIVNADINASAAISLSKLATGALPDAITVSSTNITDNTIVNADISSSAAIGLSKLATGTLPSGITIANANITDGTIGLSKLTTGSLPTGITIASANITDGAIVDADINASAAIGLSKLATGALPTAITVASANIVDGTIVDTDLSASAAISLSKLATGALPSAITIASANIVDSTIVDADISPSAAIGLSKLGTGALPTGISVASANIVDGSIVDADINAGAAIAGSKISPNFGGQNTTTTGTSTAASFNPTSSTVPANGLYLIGANSIGIATNSVQRLAVDSSGNINTSSNFTATGNVTAYSDIRLKENIKVVDNAVQKVMQLEGVTFTRTDHGEKDQRYAGVIAQSVERVLPEVVHTDENGIKSVAYGNMAALFIEAIKELQAKIESLESAK